MNRVEHTEIDKWGYVVCIGTVITFIAGIGHINSFGLIYNDFIISTNSTAQSLTTAHGLFSIMLAVGGIILNIISKHLSLKLGGLIGAVIFITGAFTTILISNTNQLPYTFGVLQGIGFGMMVPVCYSTLNYYFVKKRTFAMSLVKSVQGIIIMWYPHLLKVIISYYGFRGMLLILSGISLHTFPGMLTMARERKRKIRFKKIATGKDLENSNINEEQRDLLQINHANDNVNKESKKKIQKIWGDILQILNVKILNDLIYCNICFGISFVNLSDITFFILQPMLLFQRGYDKSEVATIISIGAGADVAGRFALAFTSNVVHLNTRLLFFIATLLTLVVRIVFIIVQEYIWIGILTGILGALRACLHVTSPLVVSNHVSAEDFPGAYAIFMLSNGVVNVIIAPLIGALRDVYEDYNPSFYALILCFIPCLVLWPLEYIFVKK